MDTKVHAQVIPPSYAQDNSHDQLPECTDRVIHSENGGSSASVRKGFPSQKSQAKWPDDKIMIAMCVCGVSGEGQLTEQAVEILRTKDRDGTLFPEFALDKKGMTEYESGREYYKENYSFDDEQYQVIASLLQEKDAAGQIRDVLEATYVWKKHHWRPDLKFISVPYGAYRRHYFCLTEDTEGVEHYDHYWRDKYELFLQTQSDTVKYDQFVDHLQAVLFSKTSDKEKVESLKTLFPSVTPENSEQAVTMANVISHFEQRMKPVVQRRPEESEAPDRNGPRKVHISTREHDLLRP